MYCISCGQQLPETALFCSRCGNEVTATSKDASAAIAQAETTKWETVMIDVRDAGRATKADIISAMMPGVEYRPVNNALIVGHCQSPSGEGIATLGSFRYTGSSHSLDELGMDDRQDAEKMLDEVITSLRSHDFELVERGTHWYSYRFRRAWTPSERTILEIAREVNPEAVPKEKKISWGLPIMIVILIFMFIYYGVN